MIVGAFAWSWSPLLRSSANLWVEKLLASFRVVQIVSQGVRVGEHHLGPFPTRVESTLAQSIKDRRTVLARVLLTATEPTLRELRLLPIRLECTLGIETGTVYVHLPFVSSDSVLVEAFKL